MAFTSNIDEVEATSTNNDLFVVPLAGGQSRENYDQSGERLDAGVLAGRKIHCLHWRNSVPGMRAIASG